jgi:hypothetical protein
VVGPLCHTMVFRCHDFNDLAGILCRWFVSGFLVKLTNIANGSVVLVFSSSLLQVGTLLITRIPTDGLTTRLILLNDLDRFWIGLLEASLKLAKLLVDYRCRIDFRGVC